MILTDFHSALKTDILERKDGNDIDWLFIKLQYSKDNFGYSLHARPKTYTFNGYQKTDFLNNIGFERQSCAFMPNNACFCIGISDSFDLNAFDSSFIESYKKIKKAEEHFEKCGLLYDRPEGNGFFVGSQSSSRYYSAERYSNSGDGHTASQINTLKVSEDEYFFYALTFISDPITNRKGFSFHYRSKHLPLSNELKAAILFFKMQLFKECPIFNFEKCYWWFLEYKHRTETFDESNSIYADSYFEAHKENFSIGIKLLIEADVELRPFDFRLLQTGKSSQDVGRYELQKTRPVEKEKAADKQEYLYDVAISFASTERDYAKKMAIFIKENNLKVFFDDFYPEQLWGKNLVEFFNDIYNKQARYCVIFISEEYNKRMWTTLERKSAQDRMLREKGNEYILPIKVDTTELPGMPGTIGYLNLTELGIDRINQLLILKLKK